jgi:hypothetical protein
VQQTRRRGPFPKRLFGPDDRSYFTEGGLTEIFLKTTATTINNDINIEAFS